MCSCAMLTVMLWAVARLQRTRSGYAEAAKVGLKTAKDVPGLLSLAEAAERFPAYRG